MGHWGQMGQILERGQVENVEGQFTAASVKHWYFSEKRMHCECIAAVADPAIALLCVNTSLCTN